MVKHVIYQLYFMYGFRLPYYPPHYIEHRGIYRRSRAFMSIINNFQVLRPFNFMSISFIKHYHE